MEPSRCCISSIALVLLKTGIVHAAGPTGERQVSVDYNQMATAQKLLLFWRKPAVRNAPLRAKCVTDVLNLLSASAGGMGSRSTSRNKASPTRSLSCGHDECGRLSSAWSVLPRRGVSETSYIDAYPLRYKVLGHGHFTGLWLPLDTLILQDVRYLCMPGAPVCYATAPTSRLLPPPYCFRAVPRLSKPESHVESSPSCCHENSRPTSRKLQ